MLYILILVLLFGLLYCYYCHLFKIEQRRFFSLARLGKYDVTPDDVYNHDYVMMLGRAMTPSKALPSYFKWKEKILVPVRDQGKCASCWAFAVADCVGDRLSIATGGKIRKCLSVQELLSCFNRHVFHCKRGGIPELTYNYVVTHGLLSEEDYPYQQLKDRTISKCQTSNSSFLRYLMPDSARVNANKDKVFGVDGTAKNLCQSLTGLIKGTKLYEQVLKKNIENMKVEIFLHGPIVGTMYVHKDLYAYDGKTVYSHSPDSPLMGGHAIEIFGWCDKGANTREPGFQDAYWICRNSWGLKWPRKLPYGLMYIKMGDNESGIESRASSIIPALNDVTQTLSSDTVRDKLRYQSYNEYVSDPERVNFMLSDDKREQYT